MITVPHGQWLRDQRQARCWNVPQMRNMLREAGLAVGKELPGDDALDVMIRRWEGNRSGISERYKLYYCRAFQIPPTSFGKAGPVSPPPANGSPSDNNATAPRVEIQHDNPELRTTMQRLCDSASRDDLCFLLGYVTATMSAVRHQNADGSGTVTTVQSPTRTAAPQVRFVSY